MLQHITRASAIRSLLLVAICATLFSFTIKVGGDSFSIYLNDQLMLQQHVTLNAKVKNFSLNLNNGDDVLKIHYSHCGKVGSERSISIQDDRKNVLKAFTFSGNTSPVMAFKLENISALPKAGHQKFYVVYASKEIPDGKLLASIQVSQENKASL